MFVIILLIIIAIIIYIIKVKKIKINFKSFKYKKVKYIDDRFGVYLITGKQGSNKTYYAIQLLLNQNPKKVNYIKTNIKSLNIPNYRIEYFTKISEIYQDTDENCIYVIDEISRKYKKTSTCDDQFYAWLNQSRKRNRVTILITQEYKELPMWIRRPAKYMLNSYSVPVLTNLFGIYAVNVGDGYNMTFNKDEGEYECPTIMTILYKRNEYVAKMYDTFEPINDL